MDKLIIIDKEWFRNLDQYLLNNKDLVYFYREAVVFHELGHCLLNKKHEETGLMAISIDLRDYFYNREEVLNEFFGKTIIYVF